MILAARAEAGRKGFLAGHFFVFVFSWLKKWTGIRCFLFI